MQPRNNPDAAGVRDTFRSLLRQLIQRWMFVQRRIVQEEDLSIPQSMMLRFIRSKSPVTLTTLAGYSGATNSAMTGLVDTLEKRGYVRRERDSVDRRRVNIVLTEKSSDLFRKLDTKGEAIFEETVRTIPQEDLLKLNETLTILVRRLGEDDIE